MQKIPIRIEPHGPSELLLGWNTGDTYVVPYLEVRFLCPCAGCVDEHTGERTIQRESIPTTVRPTEVKLVGRYGIQFSWSDGHSTGMYHFDLLETIARERGRILK